MIRRAARARAAVPAHVRRGPRGRAHARSSTSPPACRSTRRAKFYFNTLTRVMSRALSRRARAADLPPPRSRDARRASSLARDREAAAFLKDAIADKDRDDEGVPRDRPRPAAVGHRGDARHRRCGSSTEADATRAAARAHAARPARAAGDHARRASSSAPATTRSCAARSSPAASTRSARTSPHAGFPIVGDKLYAHGDDAFIEYCDEGLTPELAALFVLPRHALHAARITLPHPEGGASPAEAPLPADMAALLA